MMTTTTPPPRIHLSISPAHSPCPAWAAWPGPARALDVATETRRLWSARAE